MRRDRRATTDIDQAFTRWLDTASGASAPTSSCAVDAAVHGVNTAIDNIAAVRQQVRANQQSIAAAVEEQSSTSSSVAERIAEAARHGARLAQVD